MSGFNDFQPLEILNQGAVERRTCALVAGTVHRKTVFWVVDRLQQSQPHQEAPNQLSGDQKLEIGIGPTESFVLAWCILRMGKEAILAQAKSSLRGLFRRTAPTRRRQTQQ